MKIQSVSTNRFLKTALIAVPLLCATFPAKADKKPKSDVFVKTLQYEKQFGEKALPFMIEAPALKLGDKEVYPALVVDPNNKILYHYNLNTDLENVYDVSAMPKDRIDVSGLHSVKKVLNSKSGKTVVILEELDILTGTPIKNSIKYITNTSNKALEPNKVIYLDDEVIQTVTQELEEEQYIWIR